MNRRLREKEMVTKDAAFSINAECVAVPGRFGAVKTFWPTCISPRGVLDLMPDRLMVQPFSDGATGVLRSYNVQGANFHIGPAPDATYTPTLIYYLKVPALTGSATT